MLQFSIRNKRSARRSRFHNPQSLRRSVPLQLERLEDRTLLAVFTVLNANDSGPDSLRQAILDANGNAGPDEIDFDIAGGGVQTIAPTSPLPAISEAVTIDGTTQPGFSGQPIIELDGSAAGAGSNGLTITASGSTVRGLVINRFPDSGIVITGAGALDNVVAGNYIGTSANGDGLLPGTVSLWNAEGNANDAVDGNQGTLQNGANYATGKVGQAFSLDGVDDAIDIGNGANLQFASNQPFTLSAWVKPTAQLFNGDIHSIFGHTHRGGGSDFGGYAFFFGQSEPSLRVQITAEGLTGYIETRADFGLDMDWSHVVATYDGSHRASGLRLYKNGVELPTQIAVDQSLAGKTISYNSNLFLGQYGNDASSPVNIPPLANFPGRIDEPAIFNRALSTSEIQSIYNADSTAVGNFVGVRIDSGANHNTIGGNTAADRNIISGNTGDGVNIIGTVNPSGLVSLYSADGNANDSVGSNNGTLQEGASFALGVTGATSDQAFHFDGQGAFASFPSSGFGSNSQGTLILWAKPGVSPNAPPPQQYLGSFGLNGLAFELVAPSGQLDIQQLYGSGSPAHIYAGSPIAAGEWHQVAFVSDGLGSPYRVYLDGVRLTTTVLSQAGFTEGDWFNSVGAGNDLFLGKARSDSLFWNGDIDDVAVLSRPLSDAEVTAAYNAHGAGLGGNTVEGNYIGTNATGTAALANGGSGLTITNAAGNTVGGGVAGAGNLISGNSSTGVVITGSGATANLIQGNFIGANAAGTSPLANAGGITIYNGAHDNTIGGTTAAARNIITGNGGNGITITDTGSVGNQIRGNAIYGNGGLGIDLGGDGVTANDPGDADSGPNLLQNYPVLAIAGAGATTIVSGTLNSTPNTTYTLDFYAGPADNSNARYLGSATATTDSLGDTNFSANALAQSAIGEIVTATATDPAGNTCELAPAIPAKLGVFWDGGGNDFNWNNPLNWSGDVLPGASDDVVIDYGANDFAVAHSSGTNAIHSLASHVGLAVTGGELSVSANSQLLGALTLTNGAFGGAGDVTVAGLFTWSGGRLQGVGGHGSLTAAGGIAISGSAVLDNFQLENAVGQTATWNGNLVLQNGAVFDNYGTVDNQSDLISMSGDALAAFNNYGKFVKSAAPTGYPFSTDIAVAFNNHGTVNLQKGFLNLGSGGAPVVSSGTILGSSGTLLEFVGPSTFTAATAGHVAIDADIVAFYAPVRTLNATVAGHYRANTVTEVVGGFDVAFTDTVDNFGTVLSVDIGTLDLTTATLAPGAVSSMSLSNGTVIGTANLTVTGLFSDNGGRLLANGGAASLTAQGGMNLRGTVLFDGYTLINALGQTATWNGNLVLQNGAVFDNYGTVDNQSDLISMSGDALAAFNNYGTFVKSAAPTGYPFSTDIAVAFNNHGTVNLQKGFLNLGSGGAPVVSSGTILASSGADPSTRLGRLTLLEFEGPSTFTAAASDHVSINADWVSFENNATIAGHYQAITVTQVVGNFDVAFTGTVDNFGSVLVVASGTLDLTAATLAPGAEALANLTLSNGTVIAPQNLSVTSPFTWSTGAFRGHDGQGSLTVQGGMTISGNVSAYDFGFINPATTTWTGGTVNFYGTSRFTNLAGATFDDQIDGSFGGSHPDCPVFENAGLFLKTGGAGTTFLEMQLVNRGTVQIDSGRLSLGCGYVQDNPSPLPPGVELPPGEQPAVVINDPTPLPPSPEPPPVFSHYTQTVTGLLIEQIAGHTPPAEFGIPGADYGQLVVLGDVELDGSFAVQLLNGYTPTAGDKFLVIDNRGTEAIAGAFIGLVEGATVRVGGYGFAISYVGGTGNDVVLTAMILNSPPTALAGGAYMIHEGDPITLDASASSDPDHDALVYFWTINGHANAASGVSSTLTWAQLQALGIDDGPATFSVAVQVDDGHGHVVFSPDTTLTLENAAPMATLSNDGPVGEGVPATVSFSGQHDDSIADAAAGFHYAFDCSGGSLAGASYGNSGTASSVICIYDDGPSDHAVVARIIDKDGGFTERTTSVHVNNTDPVITALTNSSNSLCGGALQGQAVSVSAAFRDMGLLDTHTATIYWGDGSTSSGTVTEMSGSGTVSTSHAYLHGGFYTITLSVLDDDGGSHSMTTQTVIAGANVQNGVLLILGTNAVDHVSVNLSGPPTARRYQVDGNFGGSDGGLDGGSDGGFDAAGVNEIQAIMCGGDDHVQIANNIQLPALIDGGRGNDQLKGGGGHDILIGGEGDDLLVGGGGRDVLIGGVGSDRLVGNTDDDILIAGSTDFDSNDAALHSILAEWTSNRDYATRVANLKGTGSGSRLNGSVFLVVDEVLSGGGVIHGTVHDDGAADILTGSQGQDWFLFNADGENGGTRDRATDLNAAEFASDIDVINGV